MLISDSVNRVFAAKTVDLCSISGWVKPEILKSKIDFTVNLLNALQNFTEYHKNNFTGVHVRNQCATRCELFFHKGNCASFYPE